MSKHTRNQLPPPANFELNPELHRYFDEAVTSPNLRFLTGHLPAACEELRRYKEDIETRVKVGEPLKHIADLYRHKVLQFRNLCQAVKIKVPAKKTNKKKSAPVAAAPESQTPLNALEMGRLLVDMCKAINSSLIQQRKDIKEVADQLATTTKGIYACHAAAARQTTAMIAVLGRIAQCGAISVPCTELDYFRKPEQTNMVFQPPKVLL